MRVWRDWAEEHWETAGMATSIAGALVIATVLAIAFNTISTRIDRVARDDANGETPSSVVQSRVGDLPGSGAF